MPSLPPMPPAFNDDILDIDLAAIGEDINSVGVAVIGMNILCLDILELNVFGAGNREATGSGTVVTRKRLLGMACDVVTAYAGASAPRFTIPSATQFLISPVTIPSNLKAITPLLT